MADGSRWICCHLGAREHYAVPRALRQRGRLSRLITDVWVDPRGAWSRVAPVMSPRLAERFHPGLAEAAVTSFTAPLLVHEAMWRLAGLSGWAHVEARNRWFGDSAAAVIRGVTAAVGPVVVFAHSYSARAPFREAKSRGWTTVLGQIDPGATHFDRVARLAASWPEYGPAPAPPSPAYLESWREECASADRIVVNSTWSRDALAEAGVDATKLHVLPLAYSPEEEPPAFDRQYPARFTAQRPCRVLFVGTASVAKGVPPLLEAIDQLRGRPLELRLVGERGMRVPARFERHAAVRWIGAVQRLAVMGQYRDADVLVFPSYSDGFGMAQIEAQAWGLPIIASRQCGEVVSDGVNGLLLSEVSADAIADALRTVIDDPARLAAFARKARAPRADALSALAEGLCALEPR